MGELAALGAAAALAAMLFASRLPPNPDFFLPRHGGFALYRAAWFIFALPYGRALFSAFIALILLACAAALIVSLRRAHPKRLPASWTARALLFVGPLCAGFIAARLLSSILDLIQLVWFPYGSMDAREPLAVFLLGALIFVPTAAAARACLSGRQLRGAAIFFALTALYMGVATFGVIKGVGRSLDEFLQPATRGKTLYVVLTQGPRGPDREVYALAPDIFADPDPRPMLIERASGPSDARVLSALRALYEEDEKRWDVNGLQDALLLGAARGDTLAASLLLSHLSVVPPSPAALLALSRLADEDSWRIGPLAAAELSRAYAHLGDAAAAARWAAKADGPLGVAPGLLAPAESGALRSGRISGTLSSPGRARVALYRKADPEAPYLLGAAGLVAAAEPDAKGRFSFTGLTAGRYYLAIAQSAGDGPRENLSVSGSRGDLILDAKHPDLDLPPLALKLGPLGRR